MSELDKNSDIFLKKQYSAPPPLPLYWDVTQHSKQHVSQTALTDYQSTLYNIPEEIRSYFIF
jgi:hypothetical protein